ncbi:AT-rich interactive domain-containing protein 2-like [Bidens hawaiensis]|uniref:AT-rich interactive domain-containing protein 2-like n=1 Tax=Bidens hawaiensis TaxID=980011 RepID=UPI00404A6E57
MAHLTGFQDKLVKTDRLRSLFDQVLWSINKDVIWGFPPRLSDGVEADLFTLFWVVRKIGDYELVSKNELWEFVAEECGLGTVHVASLKLIYIKYLKELDQWLTHGGFKDMKLDNGDLGVLEKLDSLFHELKGFQGNAGNEGFKEKSYLDIEKTETRVSRINNVGMAKTEKGISRINNADEKDENFSGLDEKFSGLDDVDKRVSDESKITNKHNNTSDNNYNNNAVSSQKRKKAESLSLSKMLNWVANAARNPHDVGSIPNSSKWKKYKGNEVWKQVLCVKERLFAKPNVDSGNKVYGPQKKRHMMHPSMYEDDKIPVHLSSKRMRCSQRVSSVKSCSCPGCTSFSSSRTKRVKKTPQILPTVETQDDTYEDEETESVNVRAEIPEWTGFVSESDLKWLGTRMWPPLEGKNGKCDMGLVGKGRKSSCTCLVRRSADCVRVHINESRTKVKRELGQLFYKWKFHHMGEEAAVCSWSVKEESEFKSLVAKARQELTDRSKSRHEIMSNFWTRACESIPCKTKDLLVRYYFNVFMLRRRSFQNRVMPENIDSDDDEQDVALGREKIDALSINDAHCVNLDERDVGFA